MHVHVSGYHCDSSGPCRIQKRQNIKQIVCQMCVCEDQNVELAPVVHTLTDALDANLVPVADDVVAPLVNCKRRIRKFAMSAANAWTRLCISRNAVVTEQVYHSGGVIFRALPRTWFVHEFPVPQLSICQFSQARLQYSTRQALGPYSPHHLWGQGPDSPRHLVRTDSPHQLVGSDSPRTLIDQCGQVSHTTW